MTLPSEDHGAPTGPPSAPPPGWYIDPSNGRDRWWDGHAWGPLAPLPPVVPTAQRQSAPGAADDRLDAAHEQSWSSWAHLGPLLLAVLGLVTTAGVASAFAFVVPLMILTSYGDRSPVVRSHAVASLNFQLSVLLYGVVLTVGLFVGAVMVGGLSAVVLLPGLLLLGGFATVATILAARAASSSGQVYAYPLAIPFVH